MSAYNLPDLTQAAPGARERYEGKLQLMRIAAKMTNAGWLVNRMALAAHRERALTRSRQFEARVLRSGVDDALLGPAKTGQTKTMREWFRKQSAPDVSWDKRTKRPQFNTPALLEWSQHKGTSYAEVAACLYAVRKNRKLADYCATYLEFSKSDGRVHFGFNPIGTQTGRWSSSTRLRICNDAGRKTISANAQQVPKKELRYHFEGDEVATLVTESLRDCFIADPGTVLLRADYDQQELRLIAYTYGVKRLLQALESGEDAHMVTAHALFGEALQIAPDRKKDFRTAAKPCTYAISYQMSDPCKIGKYATLQKTLSETFPSITETRVKQLVERFFKLYPEIRRGQQKVRAEVERQGYRALSIDGRRLYYPPTMRGFNQALNFGMQGTGAALCDRAVLQLDPQLAWDSGEQIRGQIHDEIVVQAPFASADRVARCLEAAMSAPALIGETRAGIPASADPGLDWGSCMAWDDFVATHPNLLPTRST